MSPDRVVYSFILGWIVLLAVLIVLDWLGNPDRGGFRPKGERPVGNFRTRRLQRRRTKAQRDASVRSTLRDAYGASSLRLTWTRGEEDAVREIDDTLVTSDAFTDGEVVDVASREVAGLAYTAVVGDPLPNPDEEPPEPEADAEPERVPGWRVGVDPLALTRNGTQPSPATVRARVWKNFGAAGGFSPENLRRLRAGRAPTRTNPNTAETETARVDTATGTAFWGEEPIDPFEADS